MIVSKNIDDVTTNKMSRFGPPKATPVKYKDGSVAIISPVDVLSDKQECQKLCDCLNFQKIILWIYFPDGSIAIKPTEYKFPSLSASRPLGRKYGSGGMLS